MDKACRWSRSDKHPLHGQVPIKPWRRQGRSAKVPQRDDPAVMISTKPRSGLDAIAGQVRDVESKGLPPVHLWDPPFCGDLNMRIAADGTWFYLNSPIGRASLVK